MSDEFLEGDLSTSKSDGDVGFPELKIKNCPNCNEVLI